MKLIPLSISTILSLTSIVTAQTQAQMRTQASPSVLPESEPTTFYTSTWTPSPSSTTPSSTSRSTSIDIRYPPPSTRHAPHGYHGHNFALWSPPPRDHLSGEYYITHSSDPTLHDLQVKYTALNSTDATCAAYAEDSECPDGSLKTTYLCGAKRGTSEGLDGASGCDDVTGYDIPIGALGPTDRKYAAAWQFHSEGEGDGRRHAILAWGADETSGWSVQYERHGEGRISVLSRSEGGPSETTFNDLVSGMKDLFRELDDGALVEMVERLKG